MAEVTIKDINNWDKACTDLRGALRERDKQFEQQMKSLFKGPSAAEPAPQRSSGWGLNPRESRGGGLTRSKRR